MNICFCVMNQCCLNALFSENQTLQYDADQVVDAEMIAVINHRLQTLSDRWTISRFQLDNLPIVISELFGDDYLKNDEIRVVYVALPQHRTCYSSNPKYIIPH